ncbi:GNAT family N-acetyltransferase [Candidatus Thorarchaeota archaeon]|nr:MAG: GNAT family N-acetyltransferase [Candidatus Thorarchaeota archaeon]
MTRKSRRLQVSGFVEKRRGITLISELKPTERPKKRIEFLDRTAFSLDELADMTIMSFGYSEEDREIHGDYQSVSDRDANRRILELIKKEVFGQSPPALWQIALIDQRPAGLVVGFIPEAEYRPPHGVVGQLSVLPGFRRRGVGMALLGRIHDEFRFRDCRYGFVGTPRSNHKALKLYEKAGYVRTFGQDEFEIQI